MISGPLADDKKSKFCTIGENRKKNREFFLKDFLSKFETIIEKYWISQSKIYFLFRIL